MCRHLAGHGGTGSDARPLGATVRAEPGQLVAVLSLADGADQVDSELWLVKGGGAAHTREKVVAASAERFVVIVSSDKVVDRVGPPVPLEVLRFGLAATLRRLGELGEAVVREGVPVTADGNVIVDFLGKVGDPNELASVLAAVPGVVEHGLFPPSLVSEVLVGLADGSVERLLPG